MARIDEPAPFTGEEKAYAAKPKRPPTAPGAVLSGGVAGVVHGMTQYYPTMPLPAAPTPAWPYRS